MTSIASIIAKHRPAAFGGVGIDAQTEAGHVASHYRYYRNARGMGATAALAAAKELPAKYVQGRNWYGPRGGVGAVWTHGRDSLRWFENTAESGLRFLGWTDEINRGTRHTGWFTYPDGDPDNTLRGGVWMLPGRKGESRLVYGYAEFEGRGEVNPGSAAIVMEVHRHPMRGDDSGELADTDTAADCARWADGIAESMAEKEREYQRAYGEGRRAAEIDSEMIEARQEALPLLAEFRAVRKGRVMLSETVCELLQRSIRTALAEIERKRAARDRLWSECGTSDEDAWKTGFMDESAGGFVRAVRLGYAKRDDWQGKPEDNPCGMEGAL